MYASMGCAKFCKSLIPTGCISTDVRKEEITLFESLGVVSDRLSLVNQPSLILESEPILGRMGVPTIIGNPDSWMPNVKDCDFTDSFLLAAGCDPQWLDAILVENKPRYLAIDLHSSWIGSRTTALNRSLHKCNLLSLTEWELSMLPESLAVQIGSNNQITLLVKRGRSGVTISQGRSSYNLPPPHTATLRSDLGAGDFIFGCIGGAIASHGTVEAPIDIYCDAYMASLGMLTILLESNCPADFMNNLQKSRG